MIPTLSDTPARRELGAVEQLSKAIVTGIESGIIDPAIFTTDIHIRRWPGCA